MSKSLGIQAMFTLQIWKNRPFRFSLKRTFTIGITPEPITFYRIHFRPRAARFDNRLLISPESYRFLKTAWKLKRKKRIWIFSAIFKTPFKWLLLSVCFWGIVIHLNKNSVKWFFSRNVVKLVDQGYMLVFKLKLKTFFVSVIANLQKWNGEDTFNQNSSTFFFVLLIFRVKEISVYNKIEN